MVTLSTAASTRLAAGRVGRLDQDADGLAGVRGEVEVGDRPRAVAVGGRAGLA